MATINVSNGLVHSTANYCLSAGTSGSHVMVHTDYVCIPTANFTDITIAGNLTVHGTCTTLNTTVTATSAMYVCNAGTGPALVVNQTGAQPIIDLQDDGTSAFYIEDGGNVGIGTTTPSQALDVVGSIAMDGSATYLFGGDNEILAGQDNSGYYLFTGNGQNVAKPIYIGDNATYIRLQVNNAEAVRIDSTGKVGIGTVNPDGTFHVHTSTAGSLAADASSDDIVVEVGGHGGMSILTPDASQSALVLDRKSVV